MDFYVYLHRKKTTGEVFYVGKGCAGRAWSTTSRSSFWFNIVDKHGIDIDIVETGLQEWYAHELETDLIAFYGRRDTGAGTLVNLTDGGDGFAGLIYTEEMREKISIRVSGENHPLYNDTVYLFKNYKTGESYSGTRYNFLKDHPEISCSEVVLKGKPKAFKGWYIDELTDDDSLKYLTSGYKGIYNWNSDKQVYTFVNLKSGERFTGQRVEFNEKFNMQCANLFIDALRVGDWALENTLLTHTVDSLINNSAGLRNGRADKNIYNFYNLSTGEIVKTTRVEFYEKYNVNVQYLFNGSGTIRGWCLLENKDNIRLRECPIEYLFGNIDGSAFKGTRSAFKKKYGICVKPLFNSKRCKSVKGWSLVKPNQLAISEPAC